MLYYIRNPNLLSIFCAYYLFIIGIIIIFVAKI